MSYEIQAISTSVNKILTIRTTTTQQMKQFPTKSISTNIKWKTKLCIWKTCNISTEPSWFISLPSLGNAKQINKFPAKVPLCIFCDSSKPEYSPWIYRFYNRFPTDTHKIPMSQLAVDQLPSFNTQLVKKLFYEFSVDL